MNEITKLIAEAKTYFLATENNGTPNVRPMGSIIDIDDKLYFILAKNMNLFSELQNNSKVAISAYDGKTVLRLQATAVLDDSADTIASVYKAVPAFEKMFNESVIAPFYLSDATCSIGEMGKEPTRCTF
ncbi:MAG: pyridoxamine 5'-phosphate oxidase family protein [Sphaerochaetaceae bacterium]